MILSILALAQMPWTAHLPPRGVALDFLRPKFDGGGTSLTSAAGYLSGRFPAGGLSLRVEVPFARLSATGVSSWALGNPYVGLETTRAQSVSFELGFRPALAPDNEFATEIGLFSDVTRIEAFTPHLATLAARATYRRQTSTGMTVEAGAGPSIWIPTEGGDTEIILHHYASVGYRGPSVWAAFGLGGIMILTEDVGGFSERTIYQFGASVGMARGQVRPALHLILPLDDEMSSTVDAVIGLGVSVAIK